MLVCCWSVKGGMGTSVVAAGLAAMVAHRGGDALVVDLVGDQPDLLGVDRSGPGLADWMAAGDDIAVDALRRLECEVAPGLTLLCAGGHGPVPTGGNRLALALALTDHPTRTTVVDVGVGVDRLLGAVRPGPTRSVLVIRACYLALRRAHEVEPARVGDVVLVDEPGRALSYRDVSAALGGRDVVRVPWDPAVARAVDAGTLATRVPGALKRLERLL